MKWTDTREIALALSEAHPDWVLALKGFDDDPKHCGEKILEAIQMAWIDETE